MAKDKNLKTFLLRTLVALLPVIVFLAVYVTLDPFMVIWEYDDAYNVRNDSIALTTNTGYRSTQNFLRYNQERHFDSFIFGSSMSQNYKAEFWQPYLPDGASIYHYDAASESVDGIINKIVFLKNQGVEIRHAIIIIENQMLLRHPEDQKPLFAQHPKVSPEIDWLQFHSMYFNMFKRKEFIVYMLSGGKNVDEMINSHLATKDVANRIPEINESYYSKFDSVIASNPDEFYTPERLKNNDYQPLPEPEGARIKPKLEQKLKTLANLLSDVDYRIILPPRYNHKAFNNYDLVCLKQIFGTDRVFNYSDDPRFINNEKCYYDKSGHMTSEYCKMLLDEVYRCPLPRFNPKH